MWAKACKFVGAKEGEAWTREQEEMFARAGERYLLEGRAPNVQLRGVFERMKQWFMEVYSGAEASGLEISDAMRGLFGDMFRLSPEESDYSSRLSISSFRSRAVQQAYLSRCVASRLMMAIFPPERSVISGTAAAG